jgi:hypothetical protein
VNPDEPPAYGQVWRWKETTFMLIALASPDDGRWQVVFLPDLPESETLISSMYGLQLDPNDRIDGYERLD